MNLNCVLSFKFVRSFLKVKCSKYFSSIVDLHETLLEMSREQNKTELKTQRIKIKEKSFKYSPGIVTLQVLGSGAKGAPRSLYLFTDQSRYLFNCGEGVQRLAHEHKMKLAKLEHIFITYPSWDNIGGLPGVALTIQDVGVPEITLHGPSGTDDIFSGTRRFVILKDLSVKMAECNPNQDFEDNVMTVQYVPLYKDQTKNIGTSKSDTTTTLVDDGEDSDDIDYYAHERNRNKQKINKERNISESRKSTSVCEELVSMSMSYICRLKTKPGALNLEACVDRGVPPGPLLGKLKNGEDIVLANGKIVKSSEVTTPEDVGPIFIVVECPNEEFLDSLIKEPLFKKHQDSPTTTEDDAAFTVVHFSPTSVIQTEKYKQWMQRFKQSCLHIIVNEDNDCMGSLAVHRVQYKLNLLHNEIFPILSDVTVQKANSLDLGVRVERAKTFTSVKLRPKLGYDSSNTLVLNPDEYIKETENTTDFTEELRKLKNEITNYSLVGNEYPKILFLGTGSCIPNKTRNTSGILIQTSAQDCVILDCGESTYGQLIRFFGPNKVNEILINLKAIYVSHLHADHHIGLIGVLNGRRKAKESLRNKMQFNETIYLMAPKQIMSWLQLYHRRFEPVLQEFHMIPNTDLDVGLQKNNKFLSDLSMQNVSTVPVRHCPNAFGVCLVHSTGWKITYSGDTMPCKSLVGLGLNSDILIHEATMEDDLELEARAKLHSTTTQAINIGKQMNAKFILLTHFSQRYARLPIFNDNFSNNVGIAFDNMQISPNQLHLLPKMYSALKLMFADHYEELEFKAYKRQLKEQKKRTASQSPVRVSKISS